jgi:hypothetical protein
MEESAYDHGHIAYTENKPLTTNPYPDTSSEHDEWERGWTEAAELDDAE